MCIHTTTDSLIKDACEDPALVGVLADWLEDSGDDLKLVLALRGLVERPDRVYWMMRGGCSTSDRPKRGAQVWEVGGWPVGRPTTEKEIAVTITRRDSLRVWKCERSGGMRWGEHRRRRHYIAGVTYVELLPQYVVSVTPRPGHENHDICSYCYSCTTCWGGRVGWDCPQCYSN